jgi:hypothetical protein
MTNDETSSNDQMTDMLSSAFASLFALQVPSFLRHSIFDISFIRHSCFVIGPRLFIRRLASKT